MDGPSSALLDVLSRRNQNCSLRNLGSVSHSSDHDGIEYSRKCLVLFQYLTLALNKRDCAISKILARISER